jgi:hypothetical protein
MTIVFCGSLELYPSLNAIGAQLQMGKFFKLATIAFSGQYDVQWKIITLQFGQRGYSGFSRLSGKLT